MYLKKIKLFSYKIHKMKNLINAAQTKQTNNLID